MHLLFDLDGTLSNPFLGITSCIQYALTGLGHQAPPAENLRWCIGPPLKETFAELLGPQDTHRADEALAKYRERFGTVGLFENQLYPQIEAALHELGREGHTLSVATSKPTVYAARIVEHFGLKKYFRVVDGSELDGTRTDKADLIAYILKRDKLAPNNVIMIGDRKHDIIGARKNGVRGVGVLWGYGTAEELNAAGARVCISAPLELPAVVRTISDAVLAKAMLS